MSLKKEEPTPFADIVMKSFLKSLQCTICFATFKSGTILKKHITRSNCSRPFKCEDCPKKFQTGEKLVKHTKYCEKPSACSSCGKSFGNQARLKKHEVCHKVKSEHCEKCGKTFSRPSDLTLHMKSHANEKLYGCSFCNARFNYLGGLKSHMVTHSREMPYVCDVCEIDFKRAQTLKKHRLIHTERERNYKCELCDKRFLDLPYGTAQEIAQLRFVVPMPKV